jgi:hypothetical protein
MARSPLSDDACDRLVASRDPIDAGRLCDEAVAEVSRRLRDELLAELAGESSHASPPAARRRRHHGSRAGRGRLAAAAALAAVVVVGVLAIAGSFPAGGDRGGPLDVPAASAAVVLDRAAEAALRGTVVVPGQGQYGFVKVETGSVGGTGSAVGTRQPSWNVWVRTLEVKSDWYTANGSGRERIVRTSTSFLTRHDRAIAQSHGMTLARLTATFPRFLDGAFPARTLQTAGFLPYWEMDRLPIRPAALRRALERLLLASAGTARGSLVRQMRADPAGMFAPISQFLFLPTSPPLRAALFRVLADLPGVQLLGQRRDRLGRSGVAVAVTQGGPDRVREELLFDPATSNLLQTETVELRTSAPSASRGPSMPAGTVVEYTDFISRGVVDSITQLPGGRRLPLKPAGGGP